MKNLIVSAHPVVADRLARLRDKNASVHAFRAYVHEVSMALAYEASADLPTRECTVETPLEKTPGRMLAAAKSVLVVPILRAGLGLVSGFEALFPDCHMGHIGLYRDEETKLPVEYLIRLPRELDRPIFLVDPMLATGHSTAKAVEILLNAGAKLADIRVVTLISAPEGVEYVHGLYPDLPIYTAALDSHLNANAFIVPGLGDAGDRMFGTL
ncbi:MAG: uracil phosphoribosyltransferase [Rhodospirillales bacterium]|nr:uracil phosphoribosyltransferase [Alphaproteobacteria bacterium]MCB9987492.1 uracil phosphoribosyltransferase [Rhodospirillales bacterium]USO07534.1 MAG: uracil phosphoribosyltransferase [Rhodospirillales bacterium]